MSRIKTSSALPAVSRPGWSPSSSRAPSEGRGSRSLDFAILCERYREGPEGLGFDPRKSPEVIARRLGVSPATVRRRINEWRTQGFYRGCDVLPHPELMGGRLVVRVLDFPDAVAQERALGPLRLMDGVIQIVSSRSMLLVVYFVDSTAQAERRLMQLRGIEGIREIGSEMRLVYPPCSRKMSRADWRLVQALRRNPDAKLADLARDVGQSERTTSRRFDELLDSGAIMFDPIFDYSRFSQTLAELVVYLDSPTRLEEAGSQIRTLFPQSEHAWGASPSDLEDQAGSVQFLVCARTVAELEDRAARVAHLPGVEQAMLWYGRAIVPVQGWLNERIEGILKADAPRN